MPDSDLRSSLPADREAIVLLYRAAFPDEDLVPLVGRLLDDEINVLSLVAISAAGLTGHAAFTSCTVAGQGGGVALLGPLAVSPDFQRQGIGSALVREGLTRLQRSGAVCVCVLGDPGYYGRLGFAREDGLAPPYPLPDEWRRAWQSISLGPAGCPAGRLSVPPPWDDEAFWLP